MSTIKTLMQMVETTGQTVRAVTVTFDDIEFEFDLKGDLPDDPLNNGDTVTITTDAGRWVGLGDVETLDGLTFTPNETIH